MTTIIIMIRSQWALHIWKLIVTSLSFSPAPESPPPLLRQIKSWALFMKIRSPNWVGPEGAPLRFCGFFIPPEHPFPITFSSPIVLLPRSSPIAIFKLELNWFHKCSTIYKTINCNIVLYQHLSDILKCKWSQGRFLASWVYSCSEFPGTLAKNLSIFGLLWYPKYFNSHAWSARN